MEQGPNNQGRLQRNLTVQIQFPQDITYIEAADLLEDQYSTRAIHGIQPCRGNRMQVTFHNHAYVQKAVED